MLAVQFEGQGFPPPAEKGKGNRKQHSFIETSLSNDRGPLDLVARANRLKSND
jgi:hypothetical protein